MAIAYHLPDVSLIRVTGSDALKVLNGLCTAKLMSLTAGQATEAMFTDDRGRVLAHVLIATEPGGSGSAWIVGIFPDPAKLVAHIDRFIFREDAAPKDVTSQFRAWLVDDLAGLSTAELTTADSGQLSMYQLPGIDQGWVCDCPMTSPRSRLCLVPAESESQFAQFLDSHDCKIAAHETWQSQRIANFWPLVTSEIHERTLPQELDRDQQSISFTKGCYLGQETVARLDALGEVQKKLCLVELDGWTPVVGMRLVHEGKEVGTLTSVAPQPVEGKRLALAYMKRGWMKPGSRFVIASSAEAAEPSATGVVVPHP